MDRPATSGAGGRTSKAFQETVKYERVKQCPLSRCFSGSARIAKTRGVVEYFCASCWKDGSSAKCALARWDFLCSAFSPAKAGGMVREGKEKRSSGKKTMKGVKENENHCD